MNLFEQYDIVKNNLIDARLQQVANFLAEQNDTASVVTRQNNLIKVDYKNSPYFKRNKEFLHDIETQLEQITSKEFTVNPLKNDEAFTEELKFKYNNRFNNETVHIRKYFENNYPWAISSKGKSIVTLGDCQKTAETLGIIKQEYSLNDIEAVKNYWINFTIEAPDIKEIIKKEQGNKND